MSTIAFIGLGNMGSGMCANLAKAGHVVRAFDLNAQSVANAVQAGAHAATSIAECVSDAEYVITMLPAGKHVHAVYFDDGGVLAHADNSALLIDCSTIAVEEARSAGTQAQQRQFRAVDAPVSGGVAAANAGTLTFMVGGESADFLQATPILQAMGKNVFHAGPSGNGQAAKTANNMLLGISMIASKMQKFPLFLLIFSTIGTSAVFMLKTKHFAQFVLVFLMGIVSEFTSMTHQFLQFVVILSMGILTRRLRCATSIGNSRRRPRCRLC